MVSAADILDALPLFGFTLLSLWLLYQVPSWASALGGGTQLSSRNAEGWLEDKIAKISKASMAASSNKSASSFHSLGEAVGINDRLRKARETARTINNFGRSDKNSIKKG